MIVAIGILAAISIVAYSGIQSRANDTAVKNDLTQIAKRIHLLSADSGELPAGSRVWTSSDVASGSWLGFPEVDFVPSLDAYYLPHSGGFANVAYCTGPRQGTNQQVFQVHATSKSINKSIYASDSGLREVSTHPSAAATCTGIDYPRSGSCGYLNSNWAAGLK